MIPMAWRLVRGEWRKAVLLIFCLSVGVSARVSVDSFIARLNRALSEEARNLLTADLEISSREPLRTQQRDELNALIPPQSKTQEKISFLTMVTASKTGRTRLVELQAVEQSYPFYGSVQLSGKPDGSRWQRLFREESSVYVQSQMLAQCGVLEGDFVRIGKKDFKIEGSVLSESGLGSGLFSLGPKIWMGLNHVAETDLIGQGSRVYYSTLVSLKDPAQAVPLSKKLKEIWNLPDQRFLFSESMGPAFSISVRTYLDKQFQVQRFFERLTDYLHLISLLALLLSGIGIASVIRNYIFSRRETMAVLRVLGINNSNLIQVILLQLTGFGLAGSLLGVVLGVVFQNLFPILLSDFMPVPLKIGIHFPALLYGFCLGMGTAVYFGLIPILQIGRVKPLSVFRGDPLPSSKGIVYWGMVTLGAIIFLAVAILDARSPAQGFLFCGVLLAGGVLMERIGRFVLPRFSAWRPPFSTFGFRVGISNLGRAGLHPSASMVSLGISAILFGILTLYQNSLVQELRSESDPETAQLFFIDIQEDQIKDVSKFFNQNGVPNFVLSPMVKARYRKRNERTVGQEKSSTREEESEQLMRNREQNLSYRQALGKNERIVQGRWMDSRSKEIETSLEERFAERLGAKLGDQLTFDVQGVEIQARVTSIRKVRWSSFTPTFFILISPWALADAPKTWVGSVSGLDGRKLDSIQTDLSREFPNVNIFYIAQTSEKIHNIMKRVLWTIQFVALFALISGLIVLAGVTFSTAKERESNSILL
ncbi:MAG: FtsX-like permease family protein, partial [Elusimicrobia bacterium]|nr:FtsX-like permease family protein [Elusimicrobiota bacterium]